MGHQESYLHSRALCFLISWQASRIPSNIGRTANDSISCFDFIQIIFFSSETSLPIHYTTSSSTMSPADTLQAIHRQTTYLQREIQTLLDAQSLGLLAGLGRESDSEDDGLHSGQGPMHLPVSSVEGSPSRSLSNQIPRRLSLSTSRKTLYLSMVQLSEFKKEESTVVNSQYETLNSFLANATKVEEKRAQIESSIAKIEAEIDDSDEGLAGEEAALITEIAALQNKLDDSVSRLKHIRNQRQESGNRQKARLSSWQGALDGVEQQFHLDVASGRGLEDIIPELRVRKQQATNGGVWSLPKKRRTIGLIKEEIKERAEKLLKTREAAELESAACANGAEMWATVVEKVEKIEQALSREVDKPTSDSTPSTGRADAEIDMVGIIRMMTETVDCLKKELDVAETKRWNLLICAVGAELEALKQGKDLLQETLESVQVGSTSGTLSMMTAKSRFASDLTDGAEIDPVQDNSLARNGNVPHGERAQLIDVSEDDASPRPDRLESTGGEQSNQKLSQTSAKQPSQAREDEDEDAPGPEFFY